MPEGLAVVCESPTAGDSAGLAPYQGAAGEILRKTLSLAGFDVNSIYWANAVARLVDAGAKPSMDSIRACRERLLTELEAARPTRVLALGGLAWAAVMGFDSSSPITRERGRMAWLELPSGRVPVLATINPAACLVDTDWWRDLAYDVSKLATQKEPLAQPNPEDYWIPQTFAGLAENLRELAQYAAVSIDLETQPSIEDLIALRESPRPKAWAKDHPQAGLDPARSRILSLGIGTRDGPIVIVDDILLAQENVVELLEEFIWDPEHVVVMHNAKFDMKFLAALFGRHAPHDVPIADTMLMNWLLDERPVRSMFKAHGLKDISRYLYDTPNYEFDWPTFWAQSEDDRDYAALNRYHATDLRQTARLYWDRLAELEAVGLMQVHDEILIPATRALAQAEFNGIAVNREYLAEYRRGRERRLTRRLAGLRAAVGDPEFNPRSAQQVEVLVFDEYGFEAIESAGYKTSLGKAGESFLKRNTRQELLGALADSHAIRRPREARVLRSIVAWRHDEKAKATYADGLLAASIQDGRIRASFNLAGASTGRLSSSEPNLQNIPKRGPTAEAIRRAFVAPPGMLLMEADYSQLELRVAALLSRDERFASVYRDGRDIHREVAAVMFHKPAEDLTYMERYLAKAVDFGAIYGRGGKAISLGAEMAYYEKFMGGTRWTADEAQDFVDRFLNGFPDLRAWLTRQGYEAIRDRETKTIFGRVRRYPFMTRQGVLEVRRQAMNTPIQSVASDICLSAFSRLVMRLDPDIARPLFPIHDSILFEVDAHHIEPVARIVREEMQINLPSVVLEANRGLDIPFTVDVKAGPTWADSDQHDVEIT